MIIFKTSWMNWKLSRRKIWLENFFNSKFSSGKFPIKKCIIEYCLNLLFLKQIFPQIDFRFLWNWKEYDRNDSFPVEYEPYRIHFVYSFHFSRNLTFISQFFQFLSIFKRKLTLRSYSLQFDREQKSISLDVKSSWINPFSKKRKFFFCVCVPRKLYFHFLSNWMGYDHVDGFPFLTKWNSIWFRKS